jgi:hypothetical protein
MKMNTDKNWLKKMAEREDGCVVSVGGLVESRAAIRDLTGQYRSFENACGFKVVHDMGWFIRIAQLVSRYSLWSTEKEGWKTLNHTTAL